MTNRIGQATPGPWSTGPAHVVRQQTTDEQGRRVTRFVAEAVLSAPFVEGEREANANLIAAAPDMFEALVELHKDCLGFVKGPPTKGRGKVLFDKVEAALARARGEQPAREQVL
jgi:hypothetical protein